MRWERVRNDERKREGKEEEDDEDDEEEEDRGKNQSEWGISKWVILRRQWDKCQEKALTEGSLQEIWNSFAVRSECYEVFIPSSEITWAKQRDKSFERVENPRIGHSEWNRKECNTMSETETGLDDGDRDQMM